VAADFNGDGELDVATTGYSAGNVSILLGNGDGTFQPPQSYALGPTFLAATSLAFGDFDGRHYANGQPILDLVVRLYDGPVAVLLNKGDGTFGPATDYWADDIPEYGYQSVAVGDFNKDGKLDIVATDGYFVFELPGNGDGTFAPAQTIATSASPLAAVAVGDFNGDGTLDLAVTSPSFSYDYYGTYTNRPAEVDVLIGHGDGTFGSGPTYRFNAGGNALTTADLRGDGKLDLIVTAGASNNLVSVLRAKGDGTFQNPASFATGALDSVATGDFNGDGKLDVVTSNANTISVLLGNGNGSFQSAQSFQSSTDGAAPDSVTVGDFNGDGFPDVAAAVGTFSVLLNTGDWSTLQVSGYPSPITAGAGSFSVTAKNADGTTDACYRGTVHFTSSDRQAVLPPDYTFTAADAGVHTFSATLKTVGTQTITATDTTIAGLTGMDAGITVNPAAASTATVSGFPSPVTAGAAGNFTVTLKDPYGNTASSYTGTVHFTSSDGKAALPANYTFTSIDAGAHTFSATLKTAGTQSITAADTTSSSLTGTDRGLAVNAAAATKFIITAPASVNVGASFSITLNVEDAYGNVATGYVGTIDFSSTDTKAKLPSNYAFKATDKGVHTFTGVVLRTKGNQKITITDTHNNLLTASLIVDVL